MTDIETGLLNYLRCKTGKSSLTYATSPEPMLGGYDATIIQFSLREAPDPFSGPLVLRLLSPSSPPERAVREAAVQSVLAQLDYPAPRIAAVETKSAALGGPFLIMEHMSGRPPAAEFEDLSIASARQALRFLQQASGIRRNLLAVWNEAQKRLHNIPLDRFTMRIEENGIAAEGLHFRSALANLDRAIETGGMRSLEPGIVWLKRNRPIASGQLVVCHGDLQPLNVLADGGRLTGVIDWVRATIAEPAFDYGAALAICATVPVKVPLLLRGSIRAFLNNLARTHVANSAMLGNGSEALRYYQIFNCVQQLAAVGRNRLLGRAQGAYNSDVGVSNLTRHVRRIGGPHIGL